MGGDDIGENREGNGDGEPIDNDVRKTVVVVINMRLLAGVMVRPSVVSSRGFEGYVGLRAT